MGGIASLRALVMIPPNSEGEYEFLSETVRVLRSREEMMPIWGAHPERQGGTQGIVEEGGNRWMRFET